jgi:hypothetical protein
MKPIHDLRIYRIRGIVLSDENQFSIWMSRSKDLPRRGQLCNSFVFGESPAISEYAGIRVDMEAAPDGHARVRIQQQGVEFTPGVDPVGRSVMEHDRFVRRA